MVEYDIEKWLKNTWANILQQPVESITKNSNFFQLGGDSNSAIALISLIRNKFKRSNLLNFHTLFKFSTVQELSIAILDELTHDKDETQFEIKESKTNQFQLSFAQEQLWLHQEENHRSTTTWNVVRLLQFTKPIQLDKLEAALNEILFRNESLRVRILPQHGKVWQRISPHRQIPINHLENDGDVDATARKIRSLPLDTSSKLLISFYMMKGENSKLFISYHHILMDGTGWTNFLVALNEIYNDISRNFRNKESLRCTFSDAIKCEKRLLKNNSKIEQALQYWNRQLEDVKPIQLPTQAPAVPGDNKRPAGNILQNLQLSQDLTDKLIQLSKQQGVSLQILMLSVFKTLTFRYSGDGEQTIVTLFRSGHTLEGSQFLMSHFVNMLPIRSHIEKDQSFSSFVNSVRVSLAEGLEHGWMPYQDIMHSLSNIDRIIKAQLPKIIFQMRPEPVEPFTSLREIHLEEQGFGVADIGIDIDRSDTNGLIISVEYNPEVIRAPFIQRMLDHYAELCSSVVQFPDMSVKCLNMMPETERNLILNEFSSSGSLDLPISGLVELFQEIAVKFPQKICLKDSLSSFTFEEVDRLSDSIRDQILEHVTPSDLYVAILVPRSPSFVIGVLGILKSNRVVSPISLSHPEHYISSMLEDLSNPLVLCTKVSGNLISSYYKRIHYLDNDSSSKTSSTNHQNKPPNPMGLAYTFFTSGTTGIPKGVLVKELSLRNVIWVYVTKMNLGRDDHSLFFHNPGFDASIVDYWPSLVSGGTIYFPAESASYDPQELWTYIVKNGITYANIPTSMTKYLFANLQSFGGSLKWLAVGGEALKVPPPINFPARCINAYGPTETTVDATHVIATEASVSQNLIGRPLPNTRAYILDETLRPVSIGVRGILWLAGTGVTGGYLNRDELSAKVFVENPFAKGEVMYCSGDAARWTEDGQISLEGRLDDQVKMNGFRLELEGIEAALLTHPLIKEAAVIIVSGSSSSYLVGFCVGHEGDYLVCPRELQTYLKLHLPYYAIPKKFHFIPAIPLVSNQKIDRKALAHLYQQLASKPSTPLSPEPYSQDVVDWTEMESFLVNIWSRIFTIDPKTLTRTTTFFEVGGSSLLVGILIREINNGLERLNRKPLPLYFSDIFEYSSIESMAILLVEKAKEIELHQALITSYQRYVWHHQELQLGTEHPMYRRHRLFQLMPDCSLPALQREVLSVLTKFTQFLCLLPQMLRGQLVVKQCDWKDFESCQFVSKPATGMSLKDYLMDEMEEPYDLIGGRNPLFRSQVVQIGGIQYLAFFWHHIVLPWEAYMDLFAEMASIKDLMASPSGFQRRRASSYVKDDFNVKVFREPLSTEDGHAAAVVAELINGLELNSSEVSILYFDGPTISLAKAESLFTLVSQKSNVRFSEICTETLVDEDIFRRMAGTSTIIPIRFVPAGQEFSLAETTSPLLLTSTQSFLSSVFDLHIKIYENDFLEVEYNSDKFEVIGKERHNLKPKHMSSELVDFNANRKLSYVPYSVTEEDSWFHVLSKLWSVTLQLPLLTVIENMNIPLMKLGATSEDILQTYSTVVSMLGTQYLSLNEFYNNSSLRAVLKLCRALQSCPTTGGDSPLPFLFESELAELTQDLVPTHTQVDLDNSIKQNTGNGTVFLTGSTGYLGGFILAELLQHSSVERIYCLVRRDLEQILQNLERFGVVIDEKVFSRKVMPIKGDLSKLNFGASSLDYKKLSSEVDVVMHCGAITSMLQSYNELKPTNVVGTKELCKLAITGKLKSFHYVSTTEMYTNQFLFEKEDQVAEPFPITLPPYFHMGYTQSKWMAETLAYHIHQYVPVRIYRAGTVGLHSKLKFPAQSSFDSQFVRACNKIGTFPNSNGFAIPYADVDHVASKICTTALTLPLSDDEIFVNVTQEIRPLKDIFTIPHENPSEWYKKLKSLCQNARDDTELNNFLVTLEHRQWGNIGKLQNVFDLSVQLPFITYNPEYMRNNENSNVPMTTLFQYIHLK